MKIEKVTLNISLILCLMFFTFIISGRTMPNVRRFYEPTGDLKFAVKLNGLNLDITGFSGKIIGERIELSGFNDEMILKLNLPVKISPGEYLVTPTGKYYAEYKSIDETDYLYKSNNGKFEIIKNDTQSGLIIGKFALSMTSNSTNNKIEFTNGFFHIKYKN